MEEGICESLIVCTQIFGLVQKPEAVIVSRMYEKDDLEQAPSFLGYTFRYGYPERKIRKIIECILFWDYKEGQVISKAKRVERAKMALEMGCLTIGQFPWLPQYYDKLQDGVYNTLTPSAFIIANAVDVIINPKSKNQLFIPRSEIIRRGRPVWAPMDSSRAKPCNKDTTLGHFQPTGRRDKYMDAYVAAKKIKVTMYAIMNQISEQEAAKHIMGERVKRKRVFQETSYDIYNWVDVVTESNNKITRFPPDYFRPKRVYYKSENELFWHHNNDRDHIECKISNQKNFNLLQSVSLVTRAYMQQMELTRPASDSY
jgi:hypothetical protein